MRLKIVASAFAFVFGISAPSLAEAANAYATGNVNMRSGPGTGYARIATIPAGAAVTIRGCLSGYSWCDVSFAGRRGWASSDYLQAIYQNQRRPLIVVGPHIRLPIIRYQHPRPPHWKPHQPRPPHHRTRPPRPQPR
ncbi:MAG: SH3 domain-containing protein [Mesorhizobium sp.]